MSGRVGSITTPIITDGLVFNMDAANRASYPRSGTTATDTVSNVNGTLTNGTTFSNSNKGISSTGGNDFNIGYLQSQYTDGNIGPVQIYNRALSSNEVLHNYNALKGRFGLS